MSKTNDKLRDQIRAIILDDPLISDVSAQTWIKLTALFTQALKQAEERGYKRAKAEQPTQVNPKSHHYMNPTLNSGEK